MNAAPSTTVTCRGCQRVSPVERRFCGSCGHKLWDACPQCGADNAASERFCGTCGVDVVQFAAQREDAQQARIDEALALAAAHRYEPALEILEEVAALTDPRLSAFASRAEQEVKRLEQQREEHTTLAERAIEEARGHLEANAYERAQAVLEQLAEPLRTAEHKIALDRARACRQEVLTLSGEIRTAVEQRQTAELLPKLERLLALKPSHAQALSFAQQLRDNHVKVARARLAQHKYQEALEQLRRIPAVVSTPEVETLLDSVAELASLWDKVTGAALADERLLTLADRLCRLAPDNPEASKLRVQVAARLATKPADSRYGAPNWSPLPRETLLDAPIDWLAQPTATSAPSEAAATLKQHPGQFFTALGLALAGLGQSPIEGGLMPQGKLGVLDLFPAALSFGSRPLAGAWGLDLSDYALKAIKLVREGKSGVQVESALYMPLARARGGSLSEVDARPQAALEDFRSRAGELKNVKLCIGIAGHRVLGRFFELPPMPAKKVADSVQYEARHQLPVPLEELCWSHAVLDEAAGRAADQAPRRILVQAARETIVRDRIGLFKAAGVAVDLVQSDCVALHAALVHELFAGDTPDGEAVAAIDVGTASTNVVVSSARCVWFRTFGQGGDDFTRDLAQRLDVSWDQAEQVKRAPVKAERHHRFQEAVQPLVAQLSGEVSRSLPTYRKLFGDHPIRQVYGLGGAFQTPGLLRYLRTGK